MNNKSLEHYIYLIFLSFRLMLCLLFLTGQYHLQILNVSLEDDGPYECQVGRSVSSRAIVSRTAWLNVQSKQTHLLPPHKEGVQMGKRSTRDNFSHDRSLNQGR